MCTSLVGIGAPGALSHRPLNRRSSWIQHPVNNKWFRPRVLVEYLVCQPPARQAISCSSPTEWLAITDSVENRRKGKKLAWSAMIAGIGVLLLGLMAPTQAVASTGEKLVSTIQGRIPDWLVVLFISSFPIVELRGAIPVSVAMLGLDPLRVLPLAIVGNMLPVPFILLFLGPLSNALSRFQIFKTLFEKVFARSRNQGAAWKKNEFWALTFFVGLPLPGTGAWSGAIGAFVLGMPFGKALLANFVGVCMAGGIVTSLTMLGWKGLALAVVLFIGLPAVAILRGDKKQPGNALE